MTNVEGVYDDRKNLISEIKPFDIENLVKLKIVQGGMIPKIKNCIDAVENGVKRCSNFRWKKTTFNIR